MILGKYIKLLLDERKRVILPGFGNLEMKESGGAIPAEGDLISPPGIRVRFDSGYSKDDGLLAATIANGEKISEEEAGQRVLELVDAIKFALDKGEPYQLPGAGSFLRDSDGRVHFRVDRGWVLEPDQFGLEPLDLLELDETEEIEQVPEEPVKIANDEAFAIEHQRPEPIPHKPVARTTAPHVAVQRTPYKEHKPRRWRVIWLVAVGLIVVLAVLILIPSGNLNIPGRKAKPPAANTGQDPSPVTPVTPADQSAGDPQDFESLTPESLENEPNEAIAEPTQAAERDKYFLIAGSFSHLKNASDLQDQLKSKGVAAEVMITENRMYRVSVGSYVTIREAETALVRVKSTPGLESCWILSN
jgi:cell division protein FtsN/nucleoid DNA-binding protein